MPEPATLAPTAPDLINHARHRIALRLLPFLFTIYIFNYLDRTSVAYAAMGMTRDLGFSGRVFGLGVGIFFISYVALQIPGALLVERWSARRLISLTMFAWGLTTSLTALVHTPAQLYFARFVLGVAEAAFFPGVLVYLSHWFIDADRAKASSNFMGAIPMSFILGSPIAGWVLGHSWLHIEGWRWLFIVEGIPAILLGGTAYFVLTDWPREATWLLPEQRQWLEQKLREEAPAKTESLTLGQALRLPAVLLLAAQTFFAYLVIYTFAFWFPTMLKSQSTLSYSSIGLLGAIPYIVTFLAMQFNGWHSDKTRERRWHSALPLLIAAVALLALITLSRPQVEPLSLALMLFTLTCTAYSYLPAFWSMPSEILSKSAAAAAVGMINGVGNIAGFAGPYLFGYLHDKTGTFSYGLGVMMLCAAMGGTLTLCVPRTAV
jgi:ACS family tartrate transporter-like MFS transporter